MNQQKLIKVLSVREDKKNDWVEACKNKRYVGTLKNTFSEDGTTFWRKFDKEDVNYILPEIGITTSFLAFSIYCIVKLGQ